MSKPEPGHYVICNLVLSPSGQMLAISFNDQGAIATVRQLDGRSSRQKWKIEDFGDGITQTISPALDLNLQAAWGADGVSVLPRGNYVWNIRKTDNGYTIKNGGETVNWGIAEASNDVKVTLGGDTGNDKQRWILIRS